MLSVQSLRFLSFRFVCGLTLFGSLAFGWNALPVPGPGSLKAAEIVGPSFPWSMPDVAEPQAAVAGKLQFLLPAAEIGDQPRQSQRKVASGSTQPPESLQEVFGELGEGAAETSARQNVARRDVPVRVELSEAAGSLREPLERCLAVHLAIYRNTAENSGWSVMHSFLGGGAGTLLRVGGRQGQTVNALQWLSDNRPSAGRQLFHLSPEGRIMRPIGPGYQGHPAQFLAILAQNDVPEEHVLTIGGKRFTVRDLATEEAMTCRSHEELTFKLIGLSHYFDTDKTWVSDDGQSWDLQKIIKIELAQPINGVACGGTHRMMGFAYAVSRRQLEGKPITAQWWRAEKYVTDYHRYALSLQNADGSFSTNWFRGRANQADIDRKLQTSGHVLEWLVYSLPQERLQDPAVVKAVSFLTELMSRHRHHEWEPGPHGHAVRALRLYHERVFQAADEQATPELARRPG